MRLVVKVQFLFMGLLALAGCTQLPVTPYSTPSYYTKLWMEDIPSSPTKISVGPITDPLHRKNLACQPSRSIYINPINSSRSFSHYIRGALIEELKNNDRYAHFSTLKLTGRLEQLSFEEYVPHQMTWTIRMTFVDPKNSPYTVQTKFFFAANPDDPRFCQAVSDAFPSAVQLLITDLIKTQQFRMLLK